MDTLHNIDHFIQSQLADWEMASINYNDIENVRTKSLQLEGFAIIIQFNPKRMISSAAKVDIKSIEARPCFLCSQNRPKQQRGIIFHKYVILVNPFPIFPKHLTIPLEEHTDQFIAGHFKDMLDLSEVLPEFVIFYNGPKCGASAPDHLHFQAGSKGFLPIEKDFHNDSLRQLLFEKNKVKIFIWNNYLRGTFTIWGKDKEVIADIFDNFYKNFQPLQSLEKEPMMNILAYVENDEWLVHIFPRILHRPKQYFECGEKQILLSPASVDMGGVFITPREEDFNKISAADVADIFSQVSMDSASLQKLFKYGH